MPIRHTIRDTIPVSASASASLQFTSQHAARPIPSESSVPEKPEVPPTSSISGLVKDFCPHDFSGADFTAADVLVVDFYSTYCGPCKVRRRRWSPLTGALHTRHSFIAVAKI